MQDKVSQHSILLGPKSVLVLEGRDIHIKNLKVDGALVVRAVPGAKVTIDGLAVSNAGWKWASLEQVKAGLYYVQLPLFRPNILCYISCEDSTSCQLGGHY